MENGRSIAHVVRGLIPQPSRTAIREPITGFSAVRREASERLRRCRLATTSADEGRAMPHTQTVPVFAARSLTKIYQMGEVTVQALRGVDFELFPGEFVVLLGPSGSGKSTLLNILGGLDVPTTGEVVYQDHNLTSADDAQLTEYRRTHVGFVFQFYNLIPSLTARENVTLVTDIVEHPMTAEQALGMVGLDHRLDHFPAQLSGGEQQRVAIARAIVKRPDVLLCDEPTGALDITTGIVVLGALERVNRELGTATVVITHNAAIAGMADRVVRLADGQIAGVERNAAKINAQELQW
jgi:putative ABC transport system ATP-binding protein